MSKSFLKQFKIKKIKKIAYDNDTSLTSLQVLRKDKKPISLDDVKKLTLHYGQQAEKADDDVRIGIRGMAIDGWKTLKDMNNSILTEAEYDDYYVNKVMDTNKYHSFPQLQVYVQK
jgi:hypothetical protein